MITRYHTVFSIYEVDDDKQVLRRVESSHKPTPNQAAAGDGWTAYSDAVVTPLGLMITWGLDGNSVRRTLTSRIVWKEEVHERA